MEACTSHRDLLSRHPFDINDRRLHPSSSLRMSCKLRIEGFLALKCSSRQTFRFGKARVQGLYLSLSVRPLDTSAPRITSRFDIGAPEKSSRSFGNEPVVCNSRLSSSPRPEHPEQSLHSTERPINIQRRVGVGKIISRGDVQVSSL